VEVFRESAHRGPTRLIPTEMRVGQRRQRDDVGAIRVGDPHAGVGVMLEDLRRCFEWVVHGVPQGMWAYIQDEDVLY
jgi:hypothetical protein